jgi:hypothetical protein
MPLLQSRFWQRFRKAAPCRLFALSRFVSPLTLQLSSVDRCVALAAAAATTWFAFDAGIDCGVGKRARECKSYGAVRTHDREVNGVSHHAMPHRAIRRGGQLIGLECCGRLDDYCGLTSGYRRLPGAGDQADSRRTGHGGGAGLRLAGQPGERRLLDVGHRPTAGHAGQQAAAAPAHPRGVGADPPSGSTCRRSRMRGTICSEY